MSEEQKKKEVEKRKKEVLFGRIFQSDSSDTASIHSKISTRRDQSKTGVGTLL